MTDGPQRLGLSLPLDGFTLPECVELAQTADRLGYTDVWTTESNASDGFGLLAAIAARTRSVRLGLAVAPVYTRPPALLAMAAATLQALSGGRFWLGLGSSTEVIVEDWMGLRFERPLLRVRETVEAVRLALSGEKVAYAGATLQLCDFRLQLGAWEVPILVGALGPRMLRLAGEVADGVALSYAALPGLPAQLAEVQAGLAAAGRQVADFDVVQRLGVAVDEDEEQLLPTLRREIAGYGRSRAYNQSFARQGYPDEARGMWEAWQRRDGRAAMRAVSDRLLADTFVFGDLDACRARLAAYRAAGLRTPVVVPISAHPDPRERQRRRRRTLEALAPLPAG